MKDSNKFFYGWWIVLALMAVSGTAIALTITTFNIYLNQFTQSIGISPTQFALCSTIINITVMIFSPKVGKFLQQHTKKALLIFLTGFCLSYAAFSIATNIYILYVVAALFGFFSTGLTFMPPNILVNRWFIQKKGLAMSIALSGSAIFGMILSPFITYCIQNLSYQLAYQMIAGATFMVSSLLILWVIKAKPEDIGLKAFGVDEVETTSTQVNTQEEALAHLGPKVLKKKPFFWTPA
ncbi:MFS transporter [Acinetobacter terrestris]|uniref:MFS transporter n=1 Tax=Acinetobacter terrestris TaxID=2529843 RepID=UPI001039C1B7|nr:MFS transporter [Acinetobacter terrestris]TCB55660.1 MFS transporter [Acinetobacter terrestris]